MRRRSRERLPHARRRRAAEPLDAPAPRLAAAPARRGLGMGRFRDRRQPAALRPAPTPPSSLTPSGRSCSSSTIGRGRAQGDRSDPPAPPVGREHRRPDRQRGRRLRGLRPLLRGCRGRGRKRTRSADDRARPPGRHARRRGTSGPSPVVGRRSARGGSRRCRRRRGSCLRARLVPSRRPDGSPDRCRRALRGRARALAPRVRAGAPDRSHAVRRERADRGAREREAPGGARGVGDGARRHPGGSLGRRRPEARRPAGVCRRHGLPRAPRSQPSPLAQSETAASAKFLLLAGSVFIYLLSPSSWTTGRSSSRSSARSSSSG